MSVVIYVPPRSTIHPDPRHVPPFFQQPVGETHLTFMRTTAFAAAATAISCSTAANARPTKPAVVQPPDTLVEVAVRLVSNSAGIGRVWPGYWSGTPRFLLLQPRTAALLIYPRNPGPDFVPAKTAGIPSSVKSMSWLRNAYPAELGQNEFNVTYPSGVTRCQRSTPPAQPCLSGWSFTCTRHFTGTRACALLASRRTRSTRVFVNRS